MEKAGKKKFDVGAYTAMSIDKDEKKARNAAKIVAAFIAAGSPPPVLKRHGLDLGNVEKIKEALARFDFKTVGGLVGDKEIDAFTIAGTPDSVKQKCEDLTKAGVTQIIFGSPSAPTWSTPSVCSASTSCTAEEPITTFFASRDVFAPLRTLCSFA